MGHDNSSDTKQIVLTGEAATSLQSKKRRSRKNLNGGGSTQGAIIQLQSTTSSSDQPTASVEGINPAKIAQTSASTEAPTTIQQTGGKPKVVLRASKKPIHKVVLSVSKVAAPVVHTQKAKTRKASKKIMFSLKNLRKKLTTAKTIKKHSEEKSLDEIKKLLVESKLIKTDSKAPETMLRHMYSDFMMLKHRAL